MAKKKDEQEKVKCGDCVNGKPSQGSGHMVRDIEHREGS